MKTTPLLTLGALIGSCLITTAQDAPKRPERPQRQIPAEILKEFDKDGDGKLSDEEKAKMPRPPRVPGGPGGRRGPGGPDGKGGPGGEGAPASPPSAPSKPDGFKVE